MVYVKDGLGMTNDNAQLGGAMQSLFRRRQPIRVQGIDHVNLSVADLERSVDFYRKLFGFTVRERGIGGERQRFVIMHAGGRAFLALHERDEAPEPPVKASPNHWGFAVGALEPVIERLRELDVAIRPVPGTDDGVVRHAHSRSIYIEDPDGHEIELAEIFGGGLVNRSGGDRAA